MSKIPDTSRWPSVGESANTRYFAVEPRILAGIPRVGTVDDEKSALDNVAFQHAYFERHEPGVVIVFFDNMVSQDKGARAVYQSSTNASLLLATALVGGNLLSRAMGSFFMGLSKPTMPVKMFGTLDEAVVWAHDRIAAAEGSSR